MAQTTKGHGKEREWKVTYGDTIYLMADSQEQAKKRFFEWHERNEHIPKILKLEVVK